MVEIGGGKKGKYGKNVGSSLGKGGLEAGACGLVMAIHKTPSRLLFSPPTFSCPAGWSVYISVYYIELKAGVL